MFRFSQTTEALRSEQSAGPRAVAPATGTLLLQGKTTRQKEGHRYELNILVAVYNE